MARRMRFGLFAAVLFLPLNACGGGQDVAGRPTPTTTTTSTTTTTPPPASGESSSPDQENPCTAAALAGSIEPMDSAAGNRHVTVVVRNTGKQDCMMRGYGGVELLNAAGEPIPTTAKRNLEPAPALVRLEPNGEAGKILHWSVLAVGDQSPDGDCHPPASAIRVKLPDQVAAIDVRYAFGSVCSEGELDTSAWFAR